MARVNQKDMQERDKPQPDTSKMHAPLMKIIEFMDGLTEDECRRIIETLAVWYEVRA